MVIVEVGPMGIERIAALRKKGIKVKRVKKYLYDARKDVNIPRCWKCHHHRIWYYVNGRTKCTRCKYESDAIGILDGENPGMHE